MTPIGCRLLLFSMVAVPFAHLACGQLIDGAVNPDKIPDVVALRLVLGAIVEPTALVTATPVDGVLTPSPRQAGKLASIGLTPADASALLRAIGPWQNRIGTPNGSVDLDAVTQTTANTLQAQMSARGFAALMNYARSQKKYMKRLQVQK